MRKQYILSLYNKFMLYYCSRTKKKKLKTWTWICMDPRYVRIGLKNPASVSSVFLFLFFFWTRLWDLRLLIKHSKVWLFLTLFSQLVHNVHCLWTHEFHFSITFSIKIGLTILFIHLKIILLPYFSIFRFNFQFSIFNHI